MKKLVRGGVILSLISMFVVIIYAQSKTEVALQIPNDSQLQFNNSVLDSKIDISENKIIKDNRDYDDKKVEKIVLSKSTSGGASRGMFTATAYCLKGKTAMGHGVRKGLIAADPRILRLGSRINLSGTQYSGTYLVSDTGGKIKGKRLDIWMASCSEARRFGRRNVSVSFLGK